MGLTRQALGGASYTAHDDVDDGDDGGNGDFDCDGDAVMSLGGLGNLPASSFIISLILLLFCFLLVIMLLLLPAL